LPHCRQQHKFGSRRIHYLVPGDNSGAWSSAGVEGRS
jgi:hypothetical protein